MKKKILIIDDSALMRRVLSDIINSDQRFEVAGVAVDGLNGFDLLITHKYDAVILDINMPKMNGLELLEQMKKRNIKTKVIVVSTVAKEGAAETIRALELGAVDFVTKPTSLYETKSDLFRNKLTTAVSCATESYHLDTTSLLHRLDSNRNSFNKKMESNVNPVSSVRVRNNTVVRPIRGGKKLVALACSTGGPKALQSIVPFIPENFDAPFLIVQHMPAGFTQSLASRLNETSPAKVKEAENGESLKKGAIYIAKGGNHLKYKKKGMESMLELGNEDAVNGLRPCADIMYKSLIESDYDEIVCVVLTGMGSDGTKGILELSKSKNVYVIAQDQESSTVYGMPKVIANAYPVDEVLPLNKIADTIIKHVGVR